MKIRLRWHSLLLAMLIPATASAQAPAERMALARFRDSLRATTDTGMLRSLERREQAAAKAHKADAIPLLRAGFVQMRRGEVLAERARFGDAHSSFDHAVALQPAWPIAYAGRGLAGLNVVDNETGMRRTISALTSGTTIDEVTADFARSGEVDSTFTDGLLQLSSIALRYRHNVQFTVALNALRQMARYPVGRDHEISIARARLELAVGSTDSAEMVTSRLLAANPEDAAALMEAGRAVLRRHEVRGAELWYRGLTLADPVIAKQYRADLVAVLPDSMIHRFDNTTGEVRTRMLQQFFEVHDPGSMGTATERLAEHYLRLDRARANFLIHADVYCADIAMPMYATGKEIDERGIVWILHGPPPHRDYINLTGAPKNESWQYQRPDGSELLFHFVKTEDSVGYRRVASILDIVALSTAAQLTGNSNVKEKTASGQAVETYGAGWTAQLAQDLLYSRENTSPTYSRMLSAGKNGAAALQAAERATGDSSIAHGETATLRYELPLDARVEAIAVGTDADGTTLQVAFAIPGASLYAPAGVDPVVYPVRMRVRVVRGSEVIANIDTLRNFVSRQPIPEDGVLYGRLPLHVAPGEYQVFVAMQSRERGLVLPPQTVRVAAASTPTVDLSDIALGARTVKLPWRTARGDSIWMNPLNEFKNREPLQLYFEVLGVPAGTPYKVGLVILSAGNAQPKLQLGFNATAAGSPDAVHREVDLGRLGSGKYVLQVTISTPSGGKVVRQREFTIVK